MLALLGPAVAGGLGLLGTDVVAKASMGLTVALVASAVIAAPVWAGLKVSRFTKAMCVRGWELEAGLRKRHGLV